MAMAKLKAVAVLVLALGLLGTGTAALAYRLHAGQQPPIPPKAGEKEGPDRAREEKAQRPAPAAPGKVKEAQREAEREAQRKNYAKASDNLNYEEEKYRELEDRLTRELIKVRQKLVLEEERLRMLERDQAAERDREREEMLAVQAAVRKELKQVIVRGHVRMNEWEALSKKREAERTDRLIQARLALVGEEERLRQVERHQALQREQAEARLRAAAEQVREAEWRLRGADVQPPRAGELERKLEALLREVRELRRDLERQRPGGGRTPGR
jgi:hypothetical protein